MAAGNSVLDEIREEHKKMKGRPFKEKFSYYWGYYRVPALVAILVLFFVGNLIYTIATAKDTALSVMMINSYTDMDTESYMAGFNEYAQIDTKHYTTTLDANFSLSKDSTDPYTVANIQKFAAMVAAQELDIIMAEPKTFAEYAEGGYMLNLNDVLPADKLAAWEDRFIYYDISDDEVNGQVPVGIRVTDVPLLQESGAYSYQDDAYLGVVVNSARLDNVLAFLEYLEIPE